MLEIAKSYELIIRFFPTPPQQAGYDTRSILKQDTASLNSKFSFF